MRSSIRNREPHPFQITVKKLNPIFNVVSRADCIPRTAAEKIRSCRGAAASGRWDRQSNALLRITLLLTVQLSKTVTVPPLDLLKPTQNTGKGIQNPCCNQIMCFILLHTGRLIGLISLHSVLHPFFVCVAFNMNFIHSLLDNKWVETMADSDSWYTILKKCLENSSSVCKTAYICSVMVMLL